MDPFESVGFIDGVLRIDARIWITTDGGKVRPGVCASVAAGMVRCDGDRAEIIRAESRRVVLASADNDGGAGSIMTRHGIYEFHPVADDTDESLYVGVHEQMSALEASLTDKGADVVVFDGPLRGRNQPNGAGYVKTQKVQYLPDQQQAVLYCLEPGQRTPVFLIHAGGFTRWSLYSRLPGPISHPLSGVIRIELPGVGNSAEAINRADRLTAALPKYSSEPHKESRAPQNLYPIAGLERHLRNRLGDRELLERALRMVSVGDFSSGRR